MHLISSKATFYFKRIFPIGWLGFVTVFVLATAIIGWRSGGPQIIMAMAVGVFMLAFGYLILRRMVFDLVDEVWDDGHALVVRNRGQEDRIALSDIGNVNYSVMVNPPRVTLSLRRPSVFGDKVTFCAPLRLIPFATSPVIDELIERIGAARGRR